MLREQRVLHADDGGAMKTSTLLATLQDPGVAGSASLPDVSHDNLLRRALSRDEVPAGASGSAFVSLEDARDRLRESTHGSDTSHRHSVIGHITPDERHFGLDGVALPGDSHSC